MINLILVLEITILIQTPYSETYSSNLNALKTILWIVRAQYAENEFVLQFWQLFLELFSDITEIYHP